MTQTKIVATVGPASSSPEVLRRLIEAGVDVVRLNFSHGDHETHRGVIEAVRRIAAERRRSVALLQDLCGPKIRTGRVAGGGVELPDGAPLVITTESVEGTAERISTTYAALPGDVSPGDTILLDDGSLELVVEGVAGEEVRTRVVHGGRLRSNKGMNLPGVKLSTPALTDKDRNDLRFGVEQGVDYVALSFVRSARDVLECQKLIAELGGDAPVIAKIEKREAIDDLAAIVGVAGGLMVARGDLGVEMSTEEVPTLQKRIIAMANAAGKVVITATQMLESMVTSPRPTRAEASDVANAILDGSDAVMLSAETAAGEFPVETVETMDRIASHTESHFSVSRPERLGPSGSRVARGLAAVASQVAEDLSCKLIVAFTETGAAARLVSGFRPRVPIVGLTYSERTYNQLSLWWGVEPVLSRSADSVEQMIRDGEALLKEHGLVSPGDTVLMLVGGHHQTGATNTLRVHEVGE
jgi:pyruvate kinase